MGNKHIRNAVVAGLLGLLLCAGGVLAHRRYVLIVEERNTRAFAMEYLHGFAGSSPSDRVPWFAEVLSARTYGYCREVVYEAATDRPVDCSRFTLVYGAFLVCATFPPILETSLGSGPEVSNMKRIAESMSTGLARERMNHVENQLLHMLVRHRSELVAEDAANGVSTPKASARVDHAIAHPQCRLLDDAQIANALSSIRLATVALPDR